MYCGGSDISVIGNTLENSSGIWLRSDRRVDKKRFNLLSDAVVDDSNVGMRPGYTGIYLPLESSRPKVASLFGTGVDGIEIRNNNINANTVQPHDGVLTNGLSRLD